MRITKLKDKSVFPGIPVDNPWECLGVFRLGNLGVAELWIVEGCRCRGCKAEPRLEGAFIRWSYKRSAPITDSFGFPIRNGDTALDWSVTVPGWGAYEYTHGGEIYRRRCVVLGRLNTPELREKLKELRVGESFILQF
ncbi:hypothetical protein [Desulfurobacterium sp.]